MELALSTLLLIVLAAVLIVLGAGLVSFILGGEFNRKYANKLMRLRVATQAFAILILLALLLLRNHSGHAPNADVPQPSAVPTQSGPA